MLAIRVGASPWMINLGPIREIVRRSHDHKRRLRAGLSFVEQADWTLSMRLIDLLCEIGKAGLGDPSDETAQTCIANTAVFTDCLIRDLLLEGKDYRLEALVKTLKRLRDLCPVIARHPLACEPWLRLRHPELLELLGLEER